MKLLCTMSYFLLSKTHTLRRFFTYDHTYVFLFLAHGPSEMKYFSGQHFFHVLFQCFRNSLLNMSELKWINLLVFLPKTEKSDFFKENKLETN